MSLSFLTPLGALFAVAALAPLVVLLARQRRGRRIRRALGLPPPSLASRLPLAVALAAVPGLLALAATQPVVETTQLVRERTDAEVFVAIDTSRSMLAAPGPAGASRLERAREAALALRDAFPSVPIGIASFTDRLLPHLFPTTDRRVFAAVLDESVGIERPPPTFFFSERASTFDALAAAPANEYFSPAARRRLLVVLTDGEIRELELDLAGAFRRRPRVEPLFVRFWAEGERIYETGVAEEGYRPDPASGALFTQIASQIGGRVHAEGGATGLHADVGELLGTGPTRARTLEGERRPLMPYITLAALLPLGLVLVKRNA